MKFGMHIGIWMGMKNKLTIKPMATRVAVPYYGRLLRPGSGFERVFFLTDVDEVTGESKNLGVHIWNTKVFPEFPDWLCRHGVQGVICGDDRPVYVKALEREGIWIRCGRCGEVEEVIEDWTRNRVA